MFFLWCWSTSDNDLSGKSAENVSIGNWKHLKANECYNDAWELNSNPDKDRAWSIVNCYNANWKKEWTWIEDDDWKLWYILNYENWIPHWTITSYDRNWVKTAEWTYEHWVWSWKATYYYPNWGVEEEGYFVDDLEEWEWKSYDEDWSIFKVDKYESWELIETQFYEDWYITEIDYYEDWVIVDTQYFEDGQLLE